MRWTNRKSWAAHLLYWKVRLKNALGRRCYLVFRPNPYHPLSRKVLLTVFLFLGLAVVRSSVTFWFYVLAQLVGKAEMTDGWIKIQVGILIISSGLIPPVFRQFADRYFLFSQNWKLIALTLTVSIACVITSNAMFDRVFALLWDVPLDATLAFLADFASILFVILACFEIGRSAG